MEQVIIFDTTLRDGEQSPGVFYRLDEKLKLANQLSKLGVDILEVGFPAASLAEFEAVNCISKEVKEPIICALARAIPNDINYAWEAIKNSKRPRIHIFIGVSDIHMQNILHKIREDILEQTNKMVILANNYCADVEFSAMDSTRANPEFLFKIIQVALKAGARTINIADTCGYTTPEEFYSLIRSIQEQVPDISKAIISVHCHNDLGMATANSLAGVRAGARQIEGCINGIGERAGNAALEEVIMALHTRQDFFRLTTNINIAEIYHTSHMVCQLSGLAIQQNKAVVGANAFVHSSGIHQNGILKDRMTFEIMDPQSIGLPPNQFVLGKLSGRAGFLQRIQELGYSLSPDKIEYAFEQFKRLAARKKIINDHDLEKILSKEKRQIFQVFEIDAVQVQCGERLIPTATVKIKKNKQDFLIETAIGESSIDAVYQAINKMIQIKVDVLEYHVQTFIKGADIFFEVSIRVKNKEQTFVGYGLAIEIVTASANAYINALNLIISSSSTKIEY